LQGNGLTQRARLQWLLLAHTLSICALQQKWVGWLGYFGRAAHVIGRPFVTLNRHGAQQAEGFYRKLALSETRPQERAEHGLRKYEMPTTKCGVVVIALAQLHGSVHRQLFKPPFAEQMASV
jgi:hypothetical protein